MADKRKVLINYAHPAPHKSRINQVLLVHLRKLPFVTVNDLYACYPDFQIDVSREQSLLAAHDVIVFLHPLYWYSSPAILKEWQDVVLEYGYAYGTGGEALAGKHWLSVVSAGGGLEAYRSGGANNYPIRELLRPFEQTARLCHMVHLPPFVSFATHAMTADAMRATAKKLSATLARIVEPAFDPRSLEDLTLLSEWPLPTEPEEEAFAP